MGSRTRTEVPPSSVPCSQQGAWSEDITRQEEPGGVGGVRRCKENFWRRCSQDSESGLVTPAPGGREGVTSYPSLLCNLLFYGIQLLDKVSVDMKVLAQIKK